jgi:DNA mismatch repair protein MutS
MPGETIRDTPMMRQYRDAKEAHPGMLLLFRMGDFYETFDDDAELAAKLLGLTLTSRDKQVPMAGFPHHQLEQYLQKLLRAGQRVAVCDQVEDAALAKGLVKREVTRVVTAGTITEDELLDPHAPNYLAAVTFSNDACGLAWADLSTGEFWAFEGLNDSLADDLARLAPAECLVAERDATRFATIFDGSKTPRPDWTFDPPSAAATLFRQFGLRTLAGLGFAEDHGLAPAAAGALVAYLNETIKADLRHLRPVRPYLPDEVLRLDEVTRRSLELTRTLRDGGREGSLLSVLDRTETPMGARLLHEWLLAPLTDRAAIDLRLDAVAELASDHRLRGDLRELLGEGSDLQRLTGRVSTGRATPRDLNSVGRTVRLLPRLKAKLASRSSQLLADLDNRLDLCPDLRQALDSALVDDPPLSAKDGGVIREGYHSELDGLRAIARDGKSWIANFQAQEITRTGINSLKVGFNSVFGYYIEITHANSGRVPPDYHRKQTLKNAERYITPELKEYEEKVLGAEEKSQQLEFDLFLGLRDTVGAQVQRLQTTAEVLATLDVLNGLAELAVERRYSRPELADEPVLHIVGGRHPVLDQTLPPGTFVPNNVDLSPEAGRFWLITGPNMAGKSIFIRQVALITLLAQMGSFVPAESAEIGLCDRIFTRVGASDELSRGQSTFMVEMTEAANILHNATERSLVILDEIGRGTSTYDGVSLAWGITEHLHDAVACRSLFATHYHELAQLAETLPSLRNYNAQVQDDAGRVVFLHRIAAGSADKSYGIHVARLAGVPAPVLERAETVLAELETHHRLDAGPRPLIVDPPEKPRRRKPVLRGPDLFDV